MSRSYKEQRIRIDAIKAGITVFYDKKMLKERDTQLAYTRVEECGNYRPAIFFDLSKPIAITIITHEVIHAVRYELEFRKGFMNLDKWDDELLPYIVSYVIGEILKYCKKHKIKTIIDED